MADYSVLDLITLALTELGEYESGEVLDAADAELGRVIFNDYVHALNADAAVIFAITRTTFPITPSASTYTLGVGGTINLMRPAGPDDFSGIGFVDSALTNPTEQNVGLPLTDQAYQGIPNKTMTSPYPNYWHYQATVPLGTLRPWPIPTSATLTGVMYLRQLLTEYTDLTTLVVMPYGYRRWFRKALAVELAPAFGATIPPELRDSLREAQMYAKRPNKRPMDMQIEAAALGTIGRTRGGRYSIFTDSTS